MAPPTVAAHPPDYSNRHPGGTQNPHAARFAVLDWS